MPETAQARILRFVNKPLFVGFCFSLYAFFFRFYVYPKYSYLVTSDFPLIQSFIEWFGVAYGLFIALVLVNVWSQFETTEREFDREADAIFMLYESVKQVSENERTLAHKNEIIRRLREYVRHVNNHYKQEHDNLKLKAAGDALLEGIRDSIGSLIHTDEPQAFTSQLAREFNEAIDLRGDRIAHSKQHIPAPVWGISLWSSILWLIPFYGLNFQNDWVAVVLVGGVTAIVVAILFIIKDLDEPFDGDWGIKIDEWEILGEKVELKPTLFFVYNLESTPYAALGAFFRNLFSAHPCSLYRLLGKHDQRKDFFDCLNELAYFKFYYKDEFARLYEKRDDLPVVVYQANDKTGVILEPDDIREAATLADLLHRIQERPLPLQAP